MKVIISVFCLAIFFTVSAKAQERPKDGAVIAINESTVNVAPGSTYESEVRLVRSKKYTKAKFGGLKARAPQGLDITFKQDQEVKDLYIMSITAGDNAEMKSYSIIVKGDGNNAHKVKGVVISVNVSNEAVVNQAN